jgi:hypothetical protein
VQNETARKVLYREVRSRAAIDSAGIQNGPHKTKRLELESQQKSGPDFGFFQLKPNFLADGWLGRGSKKGGRVSSISRKATLRELLSTTRPSYITGRNWRSKVDTESGKKFRISQIGFRNWDLVFRISLGALNLGLRIAELEIWSVNGQWSVVNSDCRFRNSVKRHSCVGERPGPPRTTRADERDRKSGLRPEFITQRRKGSGSHPDEEPRMNGNPGIIRTLRTFAFLRVHLRSWQAGFSHGSTRMNTDTAKLCLNHLCESVCISVSRSMVRGSATPPDPPMPPLTIVFGPNFAEGAVA